MSRPVTVAAAMCQTWQHAAAISADIAVKARALQFAYCAVVAAVPLYAT